MKKHSIGLAAALLATASLAHAGEVEIPSILVGGSGLWNTQFKLTNIADEPAQITVTFWDGAGNRLVNQPFASSQATDADGQYTVTLSRRHTHMINMDPTYFPSTLVGSARISVTATNPGSESAAYVVGDAMLRQGSKGYVYGYVINNGQPF